MPYICLLIQDLPGPPRPPSVHHHSSLHPHPLHKPARPSAPPSPTFGGPSKPIYPSRDRSVQLHDRCAPAPAKSGSEDPGPPLTLRDCRPLGDQRTSTRLRRGTRSDGLTAIGGDVCGDGFGGKTGDGAGGLCYLDWLMQGSDGHGWWMDG
ncbi:uncharacterized protein BKA78DRAFT_321185 [Phyllosticta capitalensis]|uniref:uncharacterized protein n=1 Tax=Phyllosticta capitalensis TaxID=121624 RepID=UPI0031325FA2